MFHKYCIVVLNKIKAGIKEILSLKKPITQIKKKKNTNYNVQ